MNPLIIYLVVTNLLAFGLFWFDKWMAHVQGWRVPELILWLLMLFGGSIGGLVAMTWFRHKTKKTSFQLVAWLIVLIQMMVITLYLTGERSFTTLGEWIA